MRIGSLLSRSMQKALPDGPASKTVHHFLSTVEAAVRQYLNSVLVDAELHQYGQLLLVCGLFSSSLELHFQGILAQRRQGILNSTMTTTQLRGVCHVWDRILITLFGEGAVSKIDNFGHYILIRQRRLLES